MIDTGINTIFTSFTAVYNVISHVNVYMPLIETLARSRSYDAAL